MSRRSSRLMSGGYYNSDDESDSSTMTSISYRENPVKVFKKKSGRKSASRTTSRANSNASSASTDSLLAAAVTPPSSDSAEPTMRAEPPGPATPRPPIGQSRLETPARCPSVPPLYLYTSPTILAPLQPLSSLTKTPAHSGFDSSGYSSSDGAHGRPASPGVTTRAAAGRSPGLRQRVSNGFLRWKELASVAATAARAKIVHVTSLAARSPSFSSVMKRVVLLALLLLLIILCVWFLFPWLAPLVSRASTRLSIRPTSRPTLHNAPLLSLPPPSPNPSTPPTLDETVFAAFRAKIQALLEEMQMKQDELKTQQEEIQMKQGNLVCQMETMEANVQAVKVEVRSVDAGSRQRLEEALAGGRQHLEKDLVSGRQHLEEEIASGRQRLEKDLANGRQNLEEEFASSRQRLLQHLEEELASGRQHLEDQLASGHQHLEEELAASRQRLEKELAGGRRRLEEELNGGRQRLEEQLANIRQRQEEELANLDRKIAGNHAHASSTTAELLLRMAAVEAQNAKLARELSDALEPSGQQDPLTPELLEALERWLTKRIQDQEVSRLTQKDNCSDCKLLSTTANKMADFALESQGASVISTRCSETYRTRSACVTLFGFPLWYPSESPRIVIQGYPVLLPGKCWAFHGVQGTLVISLSHPITISHVTLDHLPRYLSPTRRIDSAPKDFAVYGMVNETDEGTLLGTFMYDEEGESTQTFELPEPSDVVYRAVELRVLSNWGHVEYTCLYRFRVHGQIANS